MAKIAPPTEKKTPVKRAVKKTSEMKSNKATGQTPPDAIIPLQLNHYALKVHRLRLD